MPVKHRREDKPQHRNRHQPAHPRNRIIHPRSHARPAPGPPSSSPPSSAAQRSPPSPTPAPPAAGNTPLQYEPTRLTRLSSANATAAIIGPTINGSLRPMSHNQSPRPPRQQKYQQNARQQSSSSLSRRIMLHLYKVQWQKEKHPAQRSVQKQRQQIRTAERLRPKQAQRQHRLIQPALHHKKSHQRRHPNHTRNQHPPPTTPRLNQRKRHTTQANRNQQRAPPVQPWLHLSRLCSPEPAPA